LPFIYGYSALILQNPSLVTYFFRNFAVSLHITIEIKIQDLSHIHEAARQFIEQIGTQAADAFFGKEVITSPALL